MRLVIVGGGPAGVFAAITTAENRPNAEVTLLERDDVVLRKLRTTRGPLQISRLVDDPDRMAAGYPHGSELMRGLLHAWRPQDMVEWLRERGLAVTASQGDSVTIDRASQSRLLEIFESELRRTGVNVITSRAVAEATRTTDGFQVWMKEGPSESCDALLLATGGHQGGLGYGIAQHFGHTLTPPIPSMAVLKTRDARIRRLQQVNVPGASVQLPELGLSGTGGVEIQAQGLGGPAIAQVTAMGARELARRQYTVLLQVNWVPSLGEGQPTRQLREVQANQGKRLVHQDPLYDLPAKLWERLVTAAKLPPDARWSSLTPPQIQALAGQLVTSRFKIEGRATDRTEWVTSGGIPLEEIEPDSLQSRRTPGLYFAGEILDIDGLPGGYNLQTAWTTGRVAGQAIGHWFQRNSTV